MKASVLCVFFRIVGSFEFCNSDGLVASIESVIRKSSLRLRVTSRASVHRFAWVLHYEILYYLCSKNRIINL